VLALAGAAAASATPGSPISAHDLATVTGGTCTTCDESNTGGGGGGGTGSSGSPVKVGSPYWSTYRSATLSVSNSPTTSDRINNWSSTTPMDAGFSYTFRQVRRVQFSGGYGSYIKAQIGGEVDISTTRSTSFTLQPMTYAKHFTRYVTERRQMYGRRYQDYSDGTRVVLGSDSGPYQTVRTVTGFVTGSLQ
jgi:hypothetical protein